MLVLHVQAAFGAFRPFAAGSYRNSAPFITPSAAYGLLLNIAGIDSRFDDGESVMTLMRSGNELPAASIAIGMLDQPQVCSLYQQLHCYPPGVGDKVADPDGPGKKITEKELGLRRTKSTKWRITPVRREILCGIDAYIALKENERLERQIREGIKLGVGRRNADNGRPCYGVPFLGDNSYLIDRLECVGSAEMRPARWYCRLRDMPPAEGSGVRLGTCRMTIRIDRKDNSQTDSDLFAPLEETRDRIPELAWVEVGPTNGTNP